jgi:hypothetical protein
MGRGSGGCRGAGAMRRRDDCHAASASRKGACPGCLLRSGGLPGPALGHGSRESHGQPSGQNAPPHPVPGAGIAVTGCLVTGPSRQDRAHATAVVSAPGPAAATVPAWPAVRLAGRLAPAGCLVPGRNPVSAGNRARGARTRPAQRPALPRGRPRRQLPPSPRPDHLASGLTVLSQTGSGPYFVKVTMGSAACQWRSRPDVGARRGVRTSHCYRHVMCARSARPSSHSGQIDPRERHRRAEALDYARNAHSGSGRTLCEHLRGGHTPRHSLRVSEATGASIEALGLERGHRTLTITRKAARWSPSHWRRAPRGLSTWPSANGAKDRSSSLLTAAAWTGTAPRGLDPVGAEGPHPALAHLAIDAASLPAAIIAAVRQIERLGIAVTSVQSTDLVSLKDIAARTVRSYESVRKLAHGQRGPGGFPAPLSAGQWAFFSHASNITFNQIWSQQASRIDLPTLAAELSCPFTGGLAFSQVKALRGHSRRPRGSRCRRSEVPVNGHELSLLRSEMRKHVSKPEDDLVLAEVAQAELAASSGDGAKSMSHLSRVGKWSLGLATSIGAGVAVEAIKAAMGI